MPEERLLCWRRGCYAGGEATMPENRDDIQFEGSSSLVGRRT